MRKSKIFTISVLLLVVILAGGIYIWDKADISQKNDNSSDNINTGKMVQKPDFQSAGNILKYETDNWYLLYEGPGKPAERALLRFSPDSVCDQMNICPDPSWKEGDRVSVSGRYNDGSILVSEIVRIR